MALTYEPLNAGQNEIRLLKIIPDETNQSPVQGTLHVVSLDDKPHFEALSYVWGDERTSMLVDNASIDVPTNLENAIRRLRGFGPNLVVWADCVCIDQSNSTELGFQLSLMGRIYSKASRVVAWIGELSPEIEEAVEYGFALQGRDFHRSDYWKKYLNKKPLSQEERYERDIAVFRVVKGVKVIFDRPYWFRLWTFQEWHLAASATILCGDMAFDELTLRKASKISRERGDIIDNLPSISSGLCEKNATHVRKIQALEQSFREYCRTASRFLPIDLGFPKKEKLSECGLYTLLENTWHRNCSKPHDRVYALLGMVTSTRAPLFPPTYDKSVERLMHETTAYIIQYDMDERVFSVFTFIVHTSNSPVPSWALDFGVKYRTPDWHRQLIRDRTERQYIEPERDLWRVVEGCQPCVTHDLSTIQLWGRSVGECKRRSEAFPSRKKHVCQVLHRRILNYQRECGSSTFLEDPEKWESRFTATWMSYLEPKRRYPLERFLDRDYNPLVYPERSEPWQEIYHNAPRISGKCFFQLTNPWTRAFGFADNSIAKGDIVIVPSGICQPIILRKKPSSEEYKIVGKAFVDGIAERDKLTPSPLVEGLRKEPLQKFHIG